MRERKKDVSITKYFQNEFIKEAQGDVHISLKGEKEKKSKSKPKEPTMEQNMPPMQNNQPMPAEAAPPAVAPMQQAAAQMPPEQMGAPGQPQSGMEGQVPPGVGMMPGPQVPGIPQQTNNMGQAGLPTTAILCNSDCTFAQNEKGMCSLNKIAFAQVKNGMFQCDNYEPAPTEQLVMPQE